MSDVPLFVRIPVSLRARIAVHARKMAGPEHPWRRPPVAAAVIELIEAGLAAAAAPRVVKGPQLALPATKHKRVAK